MSRSLRISASRRSDNGCLSPYVGFGSRDDLFVFACDAGSGEAGIGDRLICLSSDLLPSRQATDLHEGYELVEIDRAVIVEIKQRPDKVHVGHLVRQEIKWGGCAGG
jgi:hypothetical protein